MSRVERAAQKAGWIFRDYPSVVDVGIRVEGITFQFSRKVDGSVEFVGDDAEYRMEQYEAGAEDPAFS